ncbi:SDR family NAD(P)-dependent oxidoreductase [Nocardia sp. NPDC057663]|uniref:SDR family NAD(P)-dependent oxidoreductase n=1 Tax=Nocardia sp. NPDC057663 TaxID=3346201 RepID=UPI00366DEF7E
MTNLRGHVIAVTGAARGIGLATATALIEAGARVAISDIDGEQLRSAAAAIGAHFYSQLDVTDADAFAAFLADTEREVGPLTGLVNNAGIMPTGALLDESGAMTRRTVEINTLGMMFGTKAALALMVPRGRGHIVTMASTMGETAVPGLASYNASKAAAIMFSDASRLEFADSGVRFSTILPGGVNTGLTDGVDASVSIPLPFTDRTIPLVKHVEPEQVADAVVRVLTSGRSHPRVHIPASFGALLRGGRMLPLALNEALNRGLGANRKILHDTDRTKRAAYLRRAASS